jgi:hypothetical protein
LQPSIETLRKNKEMSDGCPSLSGNLKVQKDGEVNILQLFLEVWGRLAAMLHSMGAG